MTISRLLIGRASVCIKPIQVTLAVSTGVMTLVVVCAVLAQDNIAPDADKRRCVASITPSRTVHQPPEVPSRVISFDTTEGTFMNIDVSPDGETLIFDLLGDIYRLPFTGGDAVALTSGRAWDQAPIFSPDGTRVYFVSDREGHRNIWQLTLADLSLQQITHSSSDILGSPNWSRASDYLLVGLGDAKTRNSEVILHAIEPNSGDATPIDAPSGSWVDMDTFERHRPPIRIFSATESAEGEIFFSQAERDQERDRTTVRLYTFDTKTQTRTAITPSDASYNEYKPKLSLDGNLLAHFRQYDDRRTEIWIRNRTTGRHEALIALTNADDASYSQSTDSRPNYAFTPDDRQLIFWHDGKIHRVNIADGAGEIVPFRVKVEREIWSRAQPAIRGFSEAGEAKVIRWPSTSNDGQTMVFSSIGYVWIMDLQTGHLRRLTGSSDFEYMPTLSPNGRSVAYVSFAELEDDVWTSRLMIVGVNGSKSREVLADPNETYLLPSWSHDGSMIALIREVKGETGGMAKGVSDTGAAFGWTPASSGVFHEVAPAPESSERLSWFIFARFVSFDAADHNLLFSYPRSGSETILAKAALDGSGQQTIAIGTSEVGGITPAPDLKNLGLTRRDGTVWLVPFDADLERNHYVSTLSSNAHCVNGGGGYYVNWNRPSQLTFGFGQNVYQYRLDEGELESLHIKVPFAKSKAVQPIAFKGARLITLSDNAGAGPVIESGTVVIDGSRISAIGPVSDVAIPQDALTINVMGKTIMPGLLDTHYHRIGGDNLSAFKLPNPNFNDYSAIAYGVTTAWDPGGIANDGAPAAVDLQQAGRILGPRWSHSATGSIGYPWKKLTSYAGALAAVEQHGDLGVAVLKEYNTPTREQQQWLSTAAHQKGMGIVSHIQSLGGMMTRIVDGYTGGDHPYISIPFFKDVRELLRQSGYIWTPNIVIASGSLGSHEDIKYYFWRDFLDKRPRDFEKRKAMTSSDRASHTDIPEQQNVPYKIHRVSRVADQAASAARSGVHIGISAHNMPGANVHQEMWYLWTGGLPNEDVLRAATMGNAEKLGLQKEIGSLEIGKIADFLVLDENPLEDIRNTLSLQYTVQGGVVYDSDTAQRADLMGIQQ